MREQLNRMVKKWNGMEFVECCTVQCSAAVVAVYFNICLCA